jgi:hypothetical protein
MYILIRQASFLSIDNQWFAWLKVARDRLVMLRGFVLRRRMTHDRANGIRA